MLALPVIGAIAVIGLPLMRYAEKTRAEATAVEFLRRVQSAQEVFAAAGSPGYASDLLSLTTPCEGHSTAALTTVAVSTLIGAGYQVRVRPAQGAEKRGPDCHGRPTVTDYYASVEPRSPEIVAQQAYALTATGGAVFVFFDGVAPRERDMAPGGLATPLEAAGAFEIP